MEVKARNIVDIGNFSYKIDKTKFSEIKKSKTLDLDYKYEKYILSQKNVKGVDHYIPLEMFKKIYKKSSNVSRIKLIEYGNDLVKEVLLDQLSIYYNKILKEQKSGRFIAAFEHDKYISYKFIDKDKVKIITNTIIPKEKEELLPGTEIPFMIFVDQCITKGIVPNDPVIYAHCRYFMADTKSAIDFLYNERKVLYVV